MLELNGKYAMAKVFTDDIEEEAVSQIINLLNQPFAKDSNPRFMPDVHAGKGCTIGTTMKINDCTCPNLVGVDIGCGMLVIELDERIDDFARFDEIIHQSVPAGMNIHEKAKADYPIDNLHCYAKLRNPDYLIRSIGSLGGGNHFIEIDQSNDGKHWLIIHTGSRNLGKQVCEIYMDIAAENLEYGQKAMNAACNELIERLKEEGRTRDISIELAKLKEDYRKKNAAVSKDLATVSGNDLENYLHDMKICQEYAKLNRETIAGIILSEYFGKNLKDCVHWHCIHNYIDVDNRILRKGSISAQKDEMVIIPLNMRDGCIIGKGKGNPDWNFSGPHGAGRKMSRSAAKQKLNVESFEQSMEGIYSTTVNESTLDEAPAAYKNADEIIDNVSESIEIIEVIKPVYNFKAVE